MQVTMDGNISREKIGLSLVGGVVAGIGLRMLARASSKKRPLAYALIATSLALQLYPTVRRKFIDGESPKARRLPQRRMTQALTSERRIPQPYFDSTLAFLREPYEFISSTCNRYNTDLFETRFLLRKTVCMKGPEAAALFYDNQRFKREGAMLGRIKKTLLGKGGVQGLDGEAHRVRKQMFLSLMAPERIKELGKITREYLDLYKAKWKSMPQVVLYDEMCEVITRSVCDWSGVPLDESEVGRRTHELTAMFDYAGAIGPKHWISRRAREEAEKWIEGLVAGVRSGRIRVPDNMAAYVISMHRDADGQLLSPRIAAVELLNVLRPTVAVAVFIVLAAHALQRYPECREKLEENQNGYLELFVQEVRRYYPFFPAVVAVVKERFEWKNYAFPEGMRVIMDLYGTNHDRRAWANPEKFQPERFMSWDKSPFNFIPQGGGSHEAHHRCPGEWIAIELMKVASDFLATKMSYDVPEQDTQIDYSRMPALPRDRMIISNIR